MENATDDKGPVIIGVATMFWVFALISISLRFWSMRLKGRDMFTHDILMAVGFVFATALTVCIIVNVVSAGLGQHAIKLVDTPWKYVTFGKLQIAVQVVWCLSMTFVRLSILSLYMHLFSSARGLRYACIGMMAISIMWAVGEIIVNFLLCRPLSYNWDKTIAGSCVDLGTAYLSVNGSNFGIDAVIALLPMKVLWQLNMPTARRVAIMLMFALGALICSIAIARIALYQLAQSYSEAEFTYTSSTLYLFTSIEPLLGCCLACLPLLQPVSEKVAGSTAVSWAMSMMRTTRNHTQASAGHQGYHPTSSQEGLHSLTHVTVGEQGKAGHGQVDVAPGDRGIYVKHHFERSSIEMALQKPLK